MSIYILVFTNLSFILGFIIFLLLGYNKQRHHDLKGRVKSSLIAGSLQNYWYKITEPLVTILIRLRITPNKITFIGLGLNMLAAVIFSQGNWGLGGWTLVVASVFDLLDGRVARATNKVTMGGSFLDSVTDRFSEGFLMLGFIYAFRDHWMLIPVVLSFVFSYTVSFARAKSEADGVPCKGGMFQRSERILVLCLGTIFAPIFSDVVLYVAIFILLAGNLCTSVFRIRESYKKFINS
jgi:CDP-diacylglycerol--glycerol-3-phosphate 3-phosphatidyltransferase